MRANTSREMIRCWGIISHIMFQGLFYQKCSQYQKTQHNLAKKRKLYQFLYIFLKEKKKLRPNLKNMYQSLPNTFGILQEILLPWRFFSVRWHVEILLSQMHDVNPEGKNKESLHCKGAILIIIFFAEDKTKHAYFLRIKMYLSFILLIELEYVNN
jgi:hypothetical protein